MSVEVNSADYRLHTLPNEDYSGVTITLTARFKVALTTELLSHIKLNRLAGKHYRSAVLGFRPKG